MTTTEMTLLSTTESPWARRVDSFNKAWYKFSRNWLSIRIRSLTWRNATSSRWEGMP